MDIMHSLYLPNPREAGLAKEENFHIQNQGFR